MADKPEASKDGAPEGEAKKKSKLVPLIIVGGVMALEAGLIVGAMTMLKPSDAAAIEVEGQDVADREKPVELLLVEDKFQNLQTNQVWQWEVQVYLQLRTKNLEFVTQRLEERDAEIREGLSRIFAQAQHGQLKEPGLETINRQITAYMTDILGHDNDGMSRIERVIIPRCKGFPAR